MNAELNRNVAKSFLALAFTTGTTTGALAQTAAASPRAAFVGAWRLASLEEPDREGKMRKADCVGQFLFTADGHTSVQVLYRIRGRNDTRSPYAYRGYEASFGRYFVDDRSRTFAVYIEGALVRNVIGRTLRRRYTFTHNSLIVEPTSNTEHWRVVWTRDTERTNT